MKVVLINPYELGRQPFALAQKLVMVFRRHRNLTINDFETVTIAI